MPDEFLTVHDIADLLKVNQQTVRNWIDRGELVAVRVGARRVRVRRVDLDAYLAAGEQESDESAAWADVAAALRAAIAAARVKDAAALEAALTRVTDAARVIGS